MYCTSADLFFLLWAHIIYVIKQTELANAKYLYIFYASCN